MDVNRPQELHAELQAVGLPVLSIGASEDSVDSVQFERDLIDDELTLAQKVVVANRKIPGDPEITDLRNYLGSDSPEWIEYVATRREFIDRKRREKYVDKVDLLFDRLVDTFSVFDYNGNKILVVDEDALQAFKTARKAIKEELPGI